MKRKLRFLGQLRGLLLAFTVGLFVHNIELSTRLYIALPLLVFVFTLYNEEQSLQKKLKQQDDLTNG